MLRVILTAVLAGALLSSASAGDVQWVGWDDIPVFLPNTVNLPTVTFTSPVALAVIKDVGITVVKEQDSKWGVKSFTTESASQSAANQLQAVMPAVVALPRDDQAEVVKAMIIAWKGFYEQVGTDKANENHFSKVRAALVQRARAEGLTADLLDSCRAYRSELKAATSPR
jgi:hypothetical protein